MNETRAKVIALLSAKGLATEMVADLVIDIVKSGLGRLGGRPRNGTSDDSRQSGNGTSDFARLKLEDGANPPTSSAETGLVTVANPLSQRGRGVSPSGSDSALSLVSGSGPASKISGDRDLDGEFDSAFWPNYPRKTGKAEARRSYVRKAPPLQKCLETLAWQRQSPQWLAADDRGIAGAFVPLPATWLNQGRWDDEPPQQRNLFDVAVPAKVAAGRAQLVAMALRGPPPKQGEDDDESED